MRTSIMIAILMVVGLVRMNAQSCASCNENVTDYNAGSYTITTGQTFCVDSTGNFEGNLVLNGGTLCVKGVFKAKIFSFTSGTILNSGNFSSGALTLGSGKNLQNISGGVINFTGNVTLSGGQITNDGILNVRQTLTNTSGTFTNAGILNCGQLSGSNTINNTGVLNTN